MELSVEVVELSIGAVYGGGGYEYSVGLSVGVVELSVGAVYGGGGYEYSVELSVELLVGAVELSVDEAAQ